MEMTLGCKSSHTEPSLDPQLLCFMVNDKHSYFQADKRFDVFHLKDLDLQDIGHVMAILDKAPIEKENNEQDNK
ncbi:hypothetical protein BCON_0238g00190 [Botryotinia convoluta]|uniref:Uncharacterized protein n=1 Tax=Botryotinia convoluta TaxID=54673 RepID=A0A4Z1HHK8_9HELO|nr:hypothetical protein BCON_0238g00190 [Botryotinia convoluta]